MSPRGRPKPAPAIDDSVLGATATAGRVEDGKTFELVSLSSRRNDLLEASATRRANVAAADAGTIERAKAHMPKVTTDAGPGLCRDSQAAVCQHDGASAAARDPELNVQSNLDGRRKAVRSALCGSTRRAPGESE